MVRGIERIGSSVEPAVFSAAYKLRVRLQIHRVAEAIFADPADRLAISTAIEVGFPDPYNHLRTRLARAAARPEPHI